jgi:hypothetical protein
MLHTVMMFTCTFIFVNAYALMSIDLNVNVTACVGMYQYVKIK